ncbi:P-loop containing nucleoside triphosphate hydrolase [Pseudocohnilembus persalinus]|uniref:p-loop containing nucleoside triphosphate hydrolase n=1 Tax=Pseudocohnilembus persalinus TaxID=266149 RepID=A0A0V0QJH7_PSEPJ|nr:P-loop containing nucleoside triphosphate hydrolase [Pseudocohnilembus persalinus]|eukprot:KRX02356.1 P-loop containing nucleoside triphosphate hydrolase [Pseudocohnilembus persalinus]
MDSEDYHFKFRITIMGDKAVGKSALLDSIANNFGKIVENEQSEELNIKTVGYVDDDTLFKISYWEIPGSQRNAEHSFRFCLGASAAVYMFDVSRRQSFERVENWIKETEKCEIPIRILVGNKVDLYANTKGAVSKSEAQSLAQKYDMEYFETCSIGDSSISLVYDHLFTTIVNSIPNPPTPQSLIGKGILLGKRLLNSSKYQLALCDIASLYE